MIEGVDRPSGIAFLLAQLGARTSERFAARLAEFGLTPAHIGVLRIIGQQPGLSQQTVSVRMGALPSRIVRLVDDLEHSGLVERRRSRTDRRNHELHVAASASDQLARVFRVVSDHDAEVTAGLTTEEKATLAELLSKVAATQGLDPETHPSYAARRHPQADKD